MNRQTLESLIEFALHLDRHLAGINNQANVAHDALELSRIAKRLHYLDEHQDSVTYSLNESRARGRMAALLEQYDLWSIHQTNPQKPSVTVRPSGQRPTEHDLAVPY